MNSSLLRTSVSSQRLFRFAAIFLCAASLTHAQLAPTSPPAPDPDAQPKREQKQVEPDDAPPRRDAAIVLSPYEVVEDTKGYYSADTMSGTRFNSKVEDLASVTQVVTKAEMSDFAMLDINDIFAYTANTEGSYDYTAYTIDSNGSVSDNTMLNPTTANRVRGMSPANISFNNFETMTRVPIDPLDIDSVEISRGPNSSVFGLGNPSGSINMVPSTANLTRNRTEIVTRADSYSGYRTALDLNRVLWKGKLAIRGSGAFTHTGFELKPSGVNEERYNAMFKYQPFKGTTITGSVQYYKMNGNRANVSPPRDNVSYWIASGRPGWDPVTQTVHLNGQVLGPFATDGTVPDYFNRTVVSGTNHSWMYIDQSGNVAYWQPRSASSVTTPETTSGAVRLMNSSAGSYNTGVSTLGQTALAVNTQPLFTTTPTVNSKSIYDWSKVNLYDMNRDWTRTITSSFQIDQLIFKTPTQTLFGQLAFRREDSQMWRQNYFGGANAVGQSGQLLVDVNLNNLNGTPNPFFGRPYLNTGAPEFFSNPAKWDTYRAQLSYSLDLTQHKGWLHWLGLNQISGYDEYKYRIDRQYGYRNVILNNQPWINGLPHADQSAIPGGAAKSPLNTRTDDRFYVGGPSTPGQTLVQYAPASAVNYGTYPFNYGGAGNVFVTENDTLGLGASADATGGSNNVKEVLKTVGVVAQSHFLADSIVTTFGLRQDRTYTRFGTIPQKINPDGISFDHESIDHWAGGDWLFNSGRTRTAGVVVRPFQNFPVLDRTLGRTAGDMLRGLFLTYNSSNSYTPQAPAQNLQGEILPNSTGVGKDYGFGLDLFEGKLVFRLNHYEDKAVNSRFGAGTSLVGRLLTLDVTGTAAYQLNFVATQWVTQLNPGFTPDQVQAEVARETGLTVAQQANLINPALPFATTQDVVASGNEVEIDVNPSRYWTVQASVTDKQEVNSNLADSITRWIAQRMPIWTTIVDPRTHTQWWTDRSYTGSQSASDNFAINVAVPLGIQQQKDGKSDPQIRRYNVKYTTSFRLAGITHHPFFKDLTVGGSLRWESKGAIGYYGVQSLPDIVTQLDTNRPIYDRARYGLDGMISYRTLFWEDKIRTTVQLNVRNIQQNVGGLQPIGAFPDGTPNNYRILDPREFILQVKFDL